MKPHQKNRQLCRQIQRQLNLVFAGELRDPLLAGLYVERVFPAPSGSPLIVEILPDATRGPVDPYALLARLDAARSRLRSEIALAIHRKRTPWLEFRFAAVPELDDNASAHAPDWEVEP